MLGDDYTSDDEEEQAGYDDEHTAANPYCGKVGCWCHTNVEYHETVTSNLGEVTDEEVEQAYSFLGL